jgi:quinol monooxygenase YgiN
MFIDEEEWEDGQAVKERIAEREHRQVAEEVKALLSTCA